MQVQPIQPVEEVDNGNTYHYEDYLADMGNSSSTEQASTVEATPPMETEATHIGRLQAITGAKAVETKVKPRGPKAEAADYDFILVGAASAGGEGGTVKTNHCDSPRRGSSSWHAEAVTEGMHVLQARCGCAGQGSCPTLCPLSAQPGTAAGTPQVHTRPAEPIA
jgi:hypothetical protein